MPLAQLGQPVGAESRATGEGPEALPVVGAMTVVSATQLEQGKRAHPSTPATSIEHKLEGGPREHEAAHPPTGKSGCLGVHTTGSRFLDFLPNPGSWAVIP